MEMIDFYTQLVDGMDFDVVMEWAKLLEVEVNPPPTGDMWADWEVELRPEVINAMCDIGRKKVNEKKVPETKVKSGMYDETPKIQIGNFTICEFTLPPGDSIWINDNEEDATQFPKALFLPMLKKFYDDNF